MVMAISPEPQVSLGKFWSLGPGRHCTRASQWVETILIHFRIWDVCYWSSPLELSGSKAMLKHLEAAARVAEDEIYTPNIVSLVSEEMACGSGSELCPVDGTAGRS